MKLIIEDDEGRKTVVPVIRDEITIGRNERNLIRLVEKNVSRSHGRLVREDGHYYIEDLGSFTGIRVNGEKIAGKRQVDDGDLIQISEYDLILQAAPEEKPEANGVEAAQEKSAATTAPEAVAQPPPEPQAVAQAVAPKPEPEVVAAPPIDAEAEARARKLAETATIRLSDLRGPARRDPGAGRAVRAAAQAGGDLRESTAATSSSRIGAPIGLGRSDENELQLEHPSISRKHLRLHLEKGSWKVMDAESRNGVRVNGEPYAQIALRHGDVLEIGHLRFAFVERGRLVPPSSRARAAGRGAAPCATDAHRGLDRHRDGERRPALRGDLPLPPVSQRRQSSPGRRKPSAPPRCARSATRWPRTGTPRRCRALDDGAAGGARPPRSLAPYESLEREARSEDVYRELEGAVATQDWERARKLLGALAGTQTWYGARAREQAESITAGYVNLHLASAAQLRGQGQRGLPDRGTARAGRESRTREARSLAEACNAPTDPDARRSDRRASRPASPLPGPRSGAEATARRESCSPRETRSWSPRISPGAVALYQKALTLQPSPQVLGGLYRSMGIAFTRQGNIEEGAHYYRLYLPLCAEPGRTRATAEGARRLRFTAALDVGASHTVVHCRR